MRGIVVLAVAFAVPACGSVNNDERVSTGNISYYTASDNTDTHNSGMSPLGDGSASHRPAAAVKFTLEFYPLTIKSVDIYLMNDTGSDQMFNIRGITGDLLSEIDLFNPVLNQTIEQTSICTKKTIVIPETVISTGSFYIAVQWITKPLISDIGNNSFRLCADSQNDHPNTNFVRINTWDTLEFVSNRIGDLAISVNYSH